MIALVYTLTLHHNSLETDVMSHSNGAPNGSGSHPEEHEEVLVQDGQEGEHAEDGPQEIFLDDADIAELQAAMDEEGDFPMDDDEDDDEVEEVEEAGPELEGEEDDDQEMQETIEDMSSSKFRAHLNPVFSVSTHPTCPILAVSGGEDDNGYLWRLDTGEEVAKLAGHTDSVITTGWSSDGEMVATGGMDGRVRVWRRVKPAAAAGSEGAWEWAKWEFLTALEGMDEVTVSYVNPVQKWSNVLIIRTPSVARLASERCSSSMRDRRWYSMDVAV